MAADGDFGGYSQPVLQAAPLEGDGSCALTRRKVRTYCRPVFQQCGLWIAVYPVLSIVHPRRLDKRTGASHDEGACVAKHMLLHRICDGLLPVVVSGKCFAFSHRSRSCTKRKQNIYSSSVLISALSPQELMKPLFETALQENHGDGTLFSFYVQ